MQHTSLSTAPPPWNVANNKPAWHVSSRANKFYNVPTLHSTLNWGGGGVAGGVGVEMFFPQSVNWSYFIAARSNGLSTLMTFSHYGLMDWKTGIPSGISSSHHEYSDKSVHFLDTTIYFNDKYETLTRIWTLHQTDGQNIIITQYFIPPELM